VLLVTAVPAQNSLEELLQKVEAEPENTEAREKLANLYVKQADSDFTAGRKKTAFEGYKKAVKMTPNHPRASKQYWELKDQPLSDTAEKKVVAKNEINHKHVKANGRTERRQPQYITADAMGAKLQALEARVFERLEALKRVTEENARAQNLIMDLLRSHPQGHSDSPLLYVLITVILMLSLGTLVSFGIFWFRNAQPRGVAEVPLVQPHEIRLSSNAPAESYALQPLAHDLKLQLIASAEKNWRSGLYSDHSFMALVRSLSADKDPAISEKARAVMVGLKGGQAETPPAERPEQPLHEKPNAAFFAALPMVTLEAVADLIDLKTNRPGHAQRTALLARLIAKKMNQPAAMLELVYAGALIHDIGMLELEENFFIKSEIYNDSQLDYLRQHTEKGGQMMKLSVLPETIRQILLEHHERYDGSGYPASTSGDAISLPAMIVGCAETWVALTSYRPYRATLGNDAALYLMTVGEENKFPQTILAGLRQATRETELARLTA